MKWVSNAEVKDKHGLQEARRRIEVEMERFKAFERESKTKPFSLIGLAMSDRLDANEIRRQEKRETLEEFVERLNGQSEAFRAEWEELSAKKRKSREESDRADMLKRYIDWHAFHISSLEQILRKLDNGVIDPDDLDSLVESLEIFMDQYEDPDFYHDEGLYEQYNLGSDVVDATYYKPALDEPEDAKRSSSTQPTQEPLKVREVPMTAAAKAKAKKQAAREMEAAQTGGPVRPDHPSQNPPKPQRPGTPSIPPPPLPTPPTPPNRPAPILLGLIGPITSPSIKIVGVWDSAESSSQLRPPPPPPPATTGRGSTSSFIDASFVGRPSCGDLCRLRSYAPSNAYVVPSPERLLYPNEPSVMETYEFFSACDLDALAFIFYYREGVYSQFMASQELKRQNWRFHKKFGVWVKRVENGTRTVNPAFEYGTYQYLDPSAEGWGLRLRNDFTFEYEYLEDEGIASLTGGDTENAVRRPLPVQPQGRVLRS